MSIENVRCIVKMPPIEFRPLTILVGRNSAGKSTFLRTLPLLKQSLETNTSAPILWFGNLVDFGNINTISSHHSKTNDVAFLFELRNFRSTRRPFYYYSRDFFRRHDSLNISTVFAKYILGPDDDATAFRAIEITIPDDATTVRFNFNTKDTSSQAVEVNGTPATFLPETHDIALSDNNLFSAPLLIPRSRQLQRPSRRLFSIERYLFRALVSLLRTSIARKLSAGTLRNESWRILSHGKVDEEGLEELELTSPNQTLAQFYMKARSDNSGKLRNQLSAISQLSRVCQVMEVLPDIMTNYFMNVSYLKPARAASERFYRTQELSVSEIAPDGSNFPMFLASLSAPEILEFSTWVREIFGYGVEISPSEGHISILISHSGGGSVNITDTGYGVSQILPVLGILWWAGRRGLQTRNRGRWFSGRRTVAIEQPELHLHPAHQAKLADALVALINSGEKDDEQLVSPRLVIETHSEALINRLGQLVEEGRIDPAVVQVVIFAAPEDLTDGTSVSVAKFDETGALENWPFGFFRTN